MFVTPRQERSPAGEDGRARSTRWLLHHWPALLLLLLAIPIVFYGLGSYSLVNGDEEIYHVVARTMLESGDWLRLQFYEEHRVYDTFMNAPLQYWARATLIALFGSNMWTMRILSALFATASVLLTYRLAIYLVADRRAAFLAGLVQLTTLQFVWLHSARTGELEPVITFLYTLIALLFLRSVETGRSFVAHHLCLVLLLNLKTPTAIVPLLAEALCFALLPATRPAFRRFALSAALILPLGLGWHVVRMIALWEPFLDVVQAMAREASSHGQSHPLMSRLLNLHFYLLTILFGAFPYSLAYLLALPDVLRGDADRQERFRWRVVGLFALAVFIFYVLVSKHHRWYVIPAYPMLSLFLGCWLSRLPRRRESWPLLVAVACLAGGLIWTQVNLAYFPFALKSWSIPMPVYWRDWLEIPPAIGLPLVSAGLLVLLAGLRRRLGDRLRLLLAAALGIGLPLYGLVRVAQPLRYVDHQSDMAALRQELDQLMEAGEPLEYPLEPGVKFGWDGNFYLSDQYRIVVKPDRSFLLYPRQEPSDPEP